GCCALAASGHAAAPPSATINSRRPMVTVIRPSRARCVNGTIPRHERAVLTFEEGRMLVASTSIVGFGFKSGKAQNERMFFRFAPRKQTYLPILELLPLPALGERRHRGLARRGVAVRQRAIFVLPEGEVDRAAAVLHDARATTAVGASYSGVNRSSTCKLHQTK